MEITIDNAFCVAVKLSFRPVLKVHNRICTHIEKWGHNAIVSLLDMPLFSTILIMSFMWMLTFLLASSCLVIAGVISFVLTLIILQGFILMTLITVILLVSMTIGGICTLWFGIRSIFVK